MEIRLNDNSRIHCDWTKQGSLYISLYRPGNLRDGHGLLLAGTVMLDGQELTQFLSALTPPEPNRTEEKP